MKKNSITGNLELNMKEIEISLHNDTLNDNLER